MQWFWSFLVSLDQLGNTITGGNPDTTISGRVGYQANSNFSTQSHYFWWLLEGLIDFTFYPIDGNSHCLRQYQKEKADGERHQSGSNLAKFVLALLVVLVCLPLCLLTYTIGRKT